MTGDQDAWAELVAGHASLVFGTALRLGLSREEAADVSQAVWISLFEHGRSIKDPQALPRWLVVATRRAALRELRKRSGEGDVAFDELESEDRAADDLLAREERAEAVRRAMVELPARCRVLLSRLFQEDRPDYRQVSRDLSLPVGSIGPTRARCLARLYRLLHGGNADI